MTRILLPFERSFHDWVKDRDMGWESTRIPLPGSESTRAYRLTPAGERRGIVVAAHGAGNDAFFAWVGLFKRLLDAGFEVFTFDLPGHGRRNRSRFAPDQAIAGVCAALERCEGPDPCLPVHAIGVSLGGAVLLGALPRLQDRLRSAVLMVAPLRIVLSPRSILRELSLRNLRTLWREREHYGRTGLIPSFGPFKRSIYPLRLDRPAPPGAFGYVDALNEGLTSLELDDHAPAVGIPVLLVYGEKDRIVPMEQGERLADLIPSSELHRLPGGSHLSTPLDPLVAARVLTWLLEHG